MPIMIPIHFLWGVSVLVTMTMEPAVLERLRWRKTMSFVELEWHINHQSQVNTKQYTVYVLYFAGTLFCRKRQKLALRNFYNTKQHTCSYLNGQFQEVLYIHVQSSHVNTNIMCVHVCNVFSDTTDKQWNVNTFDDYNIEPSYRKCAWSFKFLH